MIDPAYLRHMYQQWQQGITEYAQFHQRFVEMVARNHKVNQDELLEQLKQYSWFHYPK